MEVVKAVNPKSKYILIVLFICITGACATKKKVGPHFKNFAYTTYGRHDNQEISPRQDQEKDSVRAQLLQEYLSQRDSLSNPSNTVPEDSAATLPTKKQTDLPFAYEDEALAEEYRVDQNVSQETYQARQEDWEYRSKVKRKKSREKPELFSVLSFLTSLGALTMGFSVNSVGTFVGGMILAALGTVTGSISLARIRAKAERRNSMPLAKLGLFIGSMLLFLGVMTIIFGSALFGLCQFVPCT